MKMGERPLRPASRVSPARISSRSGLQTGNTWLAAWIRPSLSGVWEENDSGNGEEEFFFFAALQLSTSTSRGGEEEKNEVFSFLSF